jgi:hypothetical protein
MWILKRKSNNIFYLYLVFQFSFIKKLSYFQVLEFAKDISLSYNINGEYKKWQRKRNLKKNLKRIFNIV